MMTGSSIYIFMDRIYKNWEECIEEPIKTAPSQNSFCLLINNRPNVHRTDDMKYQVKTYQQREAKSIHGESVAACSHSHTRDETPASGGDHSPPLTACSWQTACGSPSGDVMPPSSVSLGICKEKFQQLGPNASIKYQRNKNQKK